MKNERILSYKLSRKFTEADLECMSVSAGTMLVTDYATFKPNGSWDMEKDYSYDF